PDRVEDDVEAAPPLPLPGPAGLPGLSGAGRTRRGPARLTTRRCRPARPGGIAVFSEPSAPAYDLAVPTVPRPGTVRRGRLFSPGTSPRSVPSHMCVQVRRSRPAPKSSAKRLRTAELGPSAAMTEAYCATAWWATPPAPAPLRDHAPGGRVLGCTARPD